MGWLNDWRGRPIALCAGIICGLGNTCALQRSDSAAACCHGMLMPAKPAASAGRTRERAACADARTQPRRFQFMGAPALLCCRCCCCCCWPPLRGATRPAALPCGGDMCMPAGGQAAGYAAADSVQVSAAPAMPPVPVACQPGGRGAGLHPCPGCCAADSFKHAQRSLTSPFAAGAAPCEHHLGGPALCAPLHLRCADAWLAWTWRPCTALHRVHAASRHAPARREQRTRSAQAGLPGGSWREHAP